MSAGLAVAADLLVATLLLATIVSSVRLSRRMNAMKADESTMREVIAELVVATESAERATGGLRAALAESDRGLADKLGGVDRATRDLEAAIEEGGAVIERLERIIEATRRACQITGAAPRAGSPPAAEDFATVLASARALAERSSRRAGAGRA